MDRNEVFEKMKEICKDVFEDDSLALNETTTATEVDGWDSLSFLTLVNELEQTFGVAFSLDDLVGGGSLGDLLDALMKHIEENQDGGK